jgi:hypothetical protein
MAKPSEIVSLLGARPGLAPSDPWATTLAARLLGHAAQARWTDALAFLRRHLGQRTIMPSDEADARDLFGPAQEART